MNALTFIAASLVCAATATNSTDLFHTLLKGDHHRLDTSIAQAIEIQQVGLGSGIGEQLLLNAKLGASSTQPHDTNSTSLLNDIMSRPIVPDTERCQVYRRIAAHKCYRSRENSTQLHDLKRILRTSEMLCWHSFSAFVNYTVETHLQSCFQDAEQNETCTGHALACISVLDQVELYVISAATNESVAQNLHSGNRTDVMDDITKASITARNGAVMAPIDVAVSVGFVIAALIPEVDLLAAASWTVGAVVNAATGGTFLCTRIQLEKAIRTRAIDPDGIANKKKIHWWCQIFPYLFKHCYDTR